MSKRCLDCGFLSHEGFEVVVGDRALIAQGEQAPARGLHCRRNLWPAAEKMNMANIMAEVSRRRQCDHFQRHSAGRFADGGNRCSRAARLHLRWSDSQGRGDAKSVIDGREWSSKSRTLSPRDLGLGSRGAAAA